MLIRRLVNTGRHDEVYDGDVWKPDMEEKVTYWLWTGLT